MRTGRQVLLIEDSATDARLVRAAMADVRGACDLEHASDLQSGMVRLAQSGIDLVLLDLHLPESQGIDTLARVQAVAPGVPVIVVTGSDDEGLADLAMRCGAHDLIQKGTPHFVAVLRRSVGHALERVQVLEALRPATGAVGTKVVRA